MTIVFQIAEAAGHPGQFEQQRLKVAHEDARDVVGIPAVKKIEQEVP